MNLKKNQCQSSEEIIRLFGGIVERLQVLKYNILDESSAIKACNCRLDHVRQSVAQNIPVNLVLHIIMNEKNTI